MIRYGNTRDAERAVCEWSGDPSSVIHIGDFGNSVFSFVHNDERRILRFSDPDFRSLDAVIAELEFVNHLHANGVEVAPAVPSQKGSLAFNLDCSSGTLICSSIRWAQGSEIKVGSTHWNEQFFYEWGRNLARIHEVSSRLPGSIRRWQWDEELVFRQSEQLIPVDDIGSRNELKEILEECKGLDRSSSEFGLIHADHAPRNFRYDIDRNLITSFDFANCCYHWFIADVAISLSTIRRQANRQVIREALLHGYASVRDLPAEYEKLIDLFIRLRAVYYYLSRLYMYSENVTADQQQELLLAKQRVHSKVGWPQD